MFKNWMLGLLSIPLTLGAQQQPQEEVEALARSQNGFAINLFKEISPSVQENMCLSPYSVSSVLSMILSGAQGNTQKQMLQTLNLTIVPEKIDETFAKLNQQLFSKASETSNELRLIQANSIWIQSGLPIVPSFADNMEKYYRGFFRKADFANQVETARADINSWVREKTLGKIPMLFDKGELTTDSRLVLVNSIYLKARWAKQFHKQFTRQEPFFDDEDSTLSVLMMADSGEYPYLETPSFSMVKIPYVTLRSQNEQLAMLVLLPRIRGQVNNLIKEFSSSAFQTWLLSMKPENVQLYLPKFKITSAFELNQPLTKLGMVDAFTDKADFAGMSSVSLKIGLVKQKTVIDVNEDGTEAVAATGASMSLRMAMMEGTPIVFKVDHPFVYVIYDQVTGEILFLGKVMNPNI